MHFSEDDLRAALRRKDPGEEFTKRVMARVDKEKTACKPESPAGKSNGWFSAWWKLRSAWAFAVAALLVLGFAWGGYEYSEYRHQVMAQENRQRLEEAKRQQEEAERARDQAILALKIVRSKLNHVLQQAQIPVEIDKSRRQRL
jgi:hypothetical protein